MDALSLATPQSGEVNVLQDGDASLLVALRDFKNGEPVTCYYGEFVNLCAQIDTNLSDSVCFSHIAGRWAVRADRHAETGEDLTYEKVQCSTYDKGVAGFARHSDSAAKSNARAVRVDSAHNKRLIEKGVFERLDPCQRHSYIVATKHISSGEEIVVDTSVDVIDDSALDEEQDLSGGSIKGCDERPKWSKRRSSHAGLFLEEEEEEEETVASD